LVAGTVSGFSTLEQSSGSQRPMFRQELSKFVAQERKVTILWAQDSVPAHWRTSITAEATNL